MSDQQLVAVPAWALKLFLACLVAALLLITAMFTIEVVLLLKLLDLIDLVKILTGPR